MLAVSGCDDKQSSDTADHSSETPDTGDGGWDESTSCEAACLEHLDPVKVNTVVLASDTGLVAPSPFGDCDETDPDVNIHTPEVCGDSTDNDCDETVDEQICVSWAYFGEGEGAAVGLVLRASRDDPTHWAQLSDDSETSEPQARGFDAGADHAFSEAWLYPSGGALQDYGLGVASWDGASLIAVLRGVSGGNTVRILETEHDEPEVVATYTETGVTWDVRLSADGSDRGMAVGASYDAYRVDAPLSASGPLADSAALHVEGPDGDYPFGNRVLLLSDPGGDGIPELVVATPTEDKGGEGAYKPAYIFEGGLTGVVSTEDTYGRIDEAAVTALSDAGDVNGDGYSDLMVTAAYVYFGPFDDERHRDDADMLVVGASAAGWSVDDDDHVDIASASYEEQIGIFFGPFVAGTYEVEDADVVVEHHPYAWVDMLLFADVDRDGAMELVLSNSSYPSYVGYGRGLITAYDDTIWRTDK